LKNEDNFAVRHQSAHVTNEFKPAAVAVPLGADGLKRSTLSVPLSLPLLGLLQYIESGLGAM
jgi:hypothetical protein